MCVKKTVWHRLQLDDNHTHYYSKPRPSNTSNVGVPCECGLIFSDIHIFFSFLLLPYVHVLVSNVIIWPARVNCIRLIQVSDISHC